MLLQRVANWLANEVLVKSLSRSEAFQKAAVKTHQNVQAASQAGNKLLNDIAGSETAQVMQSKVTDGLSTAKTFGGSLMRNLKKEYEKLEIEGRNAK